MTDQPTAPQPWDTLPDDPADIKVPLDVLRSLCRLHMADDPTSLTPEADAAVESWLNEQAQSHGLVDWLDAFHGIAPTPDPMTVVDNHPMHLLPDDHDEVVWIKYADGSRKRLGGTARKHDAYYGRESWCSEAAMVAEAIRNLDARGEGA